MTANECYFPAMVGGRIRGVQAILTNTTGSSITPTSRNGVFYVYQGAAFKLLDFDTIAANSSVNLSKEMFESFIPTNDIKILVDTAGMAGVTVEVSVVWDVD